MEELYAYLFAAAISLSGYGPIERPVATALPYSSMLNVICTDEETKEPCLAQKGLVAAYVPDTQSIVYRNDLDLNDTSDNSYLVHEYVHALQYAHKGDPFATCEGVLQSETEAYAVQQKYLNKNRAFLKVGEVLRFYAC